MKKYILIGLTVTLLVIGIVVYKTLTSPMPVLGEKEMSNSKATVNDEVGIFKRTTSLSQQEISSITQEMDKRNRQPDSVVEYMFALALLKEENIFPDAFEYEQFSEDIFKHKEPNKVLLVRDIMNRITREGTLEKIDIVDGQWALKKDSVRILTDLHYKDLKKPVRIGILVEKITRGNEDNEDDDYDLFFITTSVWDLIDSIDERVSS